MNLHIYEVSVKKNSGKLVTSHLPPKKSQKQSTLKTLEWGSKDKED